MQEVPESEEAGGHFKLTLSGGQWTQANVGNPFGSFQGHALAGEPSVLHTLWSEQELLLWFIRLGHQEPPGAPGVAGVSKSFQARAARSCQEPPGAPRNSKEQPGAASWQPPGAARSTQELPDVWMAEWVCARAGNRV